MTDFPLHCFKAYDVRGKVPGELNADTAYRIGRAYVAETGARSVCLGHDIRLSSPALSEALAKGLTEGGADVVDIGLCGTEEVYFATFHARLDGGIMVTASHNPMDYNGMKFVREDARPISGDSGLTAIRDRAAAGDYTDAGRRGTVRQESFRDAYIEHLLGYVNPDTLRPLKIVSNPGNGCAGPVIEALEKHLPATFIRIQHDPDGTFPNGIPNPLLPERREAAAEAVRRHGADIGLAWDGDFDRCFLYDETGRFIEGYYIVGLLAQALLSSHPGETIIHDPRLEWNTTAVVRQAGGTPVRSKSGHAFMKETMRRENALYGGEMSAHHFFRDFAYCDSGMIVWLLVLDLLSRTGRPLSELVDDMISAYPCSGEINRTIADPAGAIAAVRARYEKQAESVFTLDGLSMYFPDWRFNLRLSNTEPVVRLNVESRGDRNLMETRTDDILNLLDSHTTEES